MSKKKMVRVVVPFVLKADGSSDSRTFEGLAATWDQDLGNDVIHKGAFKNALAEWKSSGEAMPLLNSHDHFDIFSAIGQMTDAKETKDGLFTKWEVIDGPDGDKVMQRLRPSKTTGRPLVGKMSIGFIPTKFSFEQPEGTDSFFDRVRHITEAQLKEVSLVLFPMNPNAAIDANSVKMFLKSLEATDVKDVTSLERSQLRKLAGRIGLLLKAQPNPTGKKQDEVDEDEDLDDELDEQDLTPPDDSDSGTSNEDDSDDEEEGNGSGDDDEGSGEGSGDGDGNKGSKGVYEMKDALAHRLSKLKLSSRTAELRDQQ